MAYVATLCVLHKQDIVSEIRTLTVVWKYMGISVFLDYWLTMNIL